MYNVYHSVITSLYSWKKNRERDSYTYSRIRICSVRTRTSFHHDTGNPARVRANNGNPLSMVASMASRGGELSVEGRFAVRQTGSNLTTHLGVVVVGGRLHDGLGALRGVRALENSRPNKNAFQVLYLKHRARRAEPASQPAKKYPNKIAHMEKTPKRCRNA